jgi:predicted DNA-binding transcriptional regulator AlpA
MEEWAMVMDLDGEELVDAPEIAARLGLKSSRQVLDLRVHRLGFPEPVGRKGRTLIWSWSQVATWSGLGLSSLNEAFFADVRVG